MDKLADVGFHLYEYDLCISDLIRDSDQQFMDAIFVTTYYFEFADDALMFKLAWA
jgi:hypothetical protein